MKASLTIRNGIRWITEIKIKNDLLIKLCCYVLVFMFLLSGYVMYDQITGLYHHIRMLKMVLLCFCLGFTLLFNQGISLVSIVSGGCCFAFLAVHLPFTEAKFNYLIEVMLPFLVLTVFSYELLRTKKLHYILEAFANLIFVFSVISLICWVLGSIMDILPARHRITYYWSDHIRPTFTYFYMYFENPIQNTSLMGKDIPRNTGIYMEAPGHSMFIVYAMLIELLYQKEINKKRILILTITMLTSLSTKGIFFIMEFILMFYWFKIRKQNNLKKMLSFLFFAAIAVIAVIIGIKVMDDKSDTGSYLIRIDDLSSALKTWMDHPIFGAGFDNTAEIVSHFRYHLRQNNGLSMGAVVLLAVGGLYLFTFYCSSFIFSFFVLRKTKYREKMIILGVILFTNLVISNIQFGIIFIFITSMGFALTVYSVTGGKIGKGEWFDGSAKCKEKLHL